MSKRAIPEINSEVVMQQAVIDPTVITVQMLWREIGALKELMHVQTDSIETSIRAAHEDMVRVPTEVQRYVGTLKELTVEKLNSLCTELKALQITVDEMRVSALRHLESDHNLALRVTELGASLAAHKELVSANKMEAHHAVIAALAAAKELSTEQNKAKAEAINKSEGATSKQIQDLNTLLIATNNAIESKVYEVKDRLTKIESKVEGVKEFKGESRDNGKYIIAFIGLAFGIVGSIIGWLGTRP